MHLLMSFKLKLMYPLIENKELLQKKKMISLKNNNMHIQIKNK